MGGVATIILTGLSVGVKMYSNEMQNEATQAAIRRRMTQERLSAANKTQQRQRQLESVISRQNAEFGMRGLDPASASFVAIQQDSFDQFAKDQTAQNLTMKFQTEYYDGLSKQSDQKELFGDIGDIFSSAASYGLATSFTMPNVGTGKTAIPSSDVLNRGAKFFNEANLSTDVRRRNLLDFREPSGVTF